MSDNTVTAQTAQSVTIHTVLSDGTTMRTLDYQVPVTQILRSVPGTVTATTGGGSTFSRILQAPLATGQSVQLSETGTTDGVWFVNVLDSLSGPGSSSSSVQVSLQQASATVPPAPGQALWLLPSLMDPSAGVQVLAASVSATAGGSAQAMTAPSNCNVTTNSILHTIDNPNPQPFGSFEVWYSQFILCGQLANGAYSFYYEEEDGVADSPLHNWFALRSSVQWVGTLTTASATGAGTADFFGVFPTAVSQLWQGHASQQTTLTTTDHQVVMNGEIDWFDTINGIWSVWSTRQFYDGTQSFPNDGASQEGSWYVVNCNAALICLN